MGWEAGQWKEWTCKLCACKGMSMNRHYCRRCYAPWWVKKSQVSLVEKPESTSKWEKEGMPAWLKAKKENSKPNIKPTTDLEALNKCLQLLDGMEEVGVLKESLQTKIQDVQKQDGVDPVELANAKESSKLMAEQKKYQAALDAMLLLEDYTDSVSSLEQKIKSIESRLQELAKKPAEDRMKSLQDKKAHRTRVQKDLEQKVLAATEALEELQKQEKENNTELVSIQKDIAGVMTELNLKNAIGGIQQAATEMKKDQAQESVTPTKKGETLHTASTGATPHGDPGKGRQPPGVLPKGASGEVGGGHHMPVDSMDLTMEEEKTEEDPDPANSHPVFVAVEKGRKTNRHTEY